MIGLILATHGKMADGLADALGMILGEVENFEILNLNPDDDVSDLKDKILEAYETVDQDEGVIIFTDLMSASPFNQSTIAINSLPEEKQDSTYVLAGVNLPMLLEAANQNMMSASVLDAVAAIEQSGSEGIVKWSMADMIIDDDDDF